MSSKTESTKTENALAVRSSSDVAALDDFDRIITGVIEAPDVIEDPEAISREIIMQLLAAETDEELQTFGGATGWRELLSVPVELRGFKWRKSDYSEGSPIYVIVQGFRTDTGEAVILTTGASNVLAQLSNLARRRVLVGAVWSLEEAERETAAGFKPLHLRKHRDATEATS